jgi:hypothetical protein
MIPCTFYLLCSGHTNDTSCEDVFTDFSCVCRTSFSTWMAVLSCRAAFCPGCKQHLEEQLLADADNIKNATAGKKGIRNAASPRNGLAEKFTDKSTSLVQAMERQHCIAVFTGAAKEEPCACLDASVHALACCILVKECMCSSWFS